MVPRLRSHPLLRQLWQVDKAPTVRRTGRQLSTGHIFENSGSAIAGASIKVLESTEAIIVGIHSSTGLPWYASIPLFAVLLRLAFTAPLTYYSTTRAHKTIELSPLISAWQHRYVREIKAEDEKAARETGKPIYGEKEFRAEVAKKTKEKRKEIFERFGCQRWKSYFGLVQLPIWVVASLSLRRMAGIQGLWQRFDSNEAVPAVVESEAAQPPPPTLSEESHLDEIEPEMTLEDALALVNAPVNTVRRILDTDLVQSLSTEGIPGWFPNLLEPDPYYILPCLFGAAILVNSELVARRVENPARIQRYMRNAVAFLAVAVVPLTANQPSLLLIYWTTSATYSLVQNVVLDHFLPRPEIIKSLKPKPLPLSAKFGDVEGGGRMLSVVDKLPYGINYFGPLVTKHKTAKTKKKPFS